MTTAFSEALPDHAVGCWFAGGEFQLDKLKFFGEQSSSEPPKSLSSAVEDALISMATTCYRRSQALTWQAKTDQLLVMRSTDRGIGLEPQMGKAKIHIRASLEYLSALTRN